jgi:hypothetical protein
MMCGPCGLSWDTNDSDPPICPFTEMPGPENDAARIQWADAEADRLAAEVTSTPPSPPLPEPRTPEEKMVREHIDRALSNLESGRLRGEDTC